MEDCEGLERANPLPNWQDRKGSQGPVRRHRKGSAAVDQGTLVEEQIYDGRRFVERFAADGNPVQAAFWVKTAEEGIWFLYVATEIFDRDGPAATYRAVEAS